MPCASTGISLSFSRRRASHACRAGSAARARRRRRRSGRPSCPPAPARSRGWPRPSTCRRRPCRCRSRSASAAACAAVIAIRASLDAARSRAPRRAARPRAASRSRALRPVASTMIVATPSASLRERMRSSCGRPVSGSAGWSMRSAHRKRAARLPLFFARHASIFGGDEHHFRVGRPRARPVHRHQGAVGPERQRRAAAAIRRPTTAPATARGANRRGAGAGRRSAARNVSALDELLRRSRARFGGGGGGGLPGRPDRSLILWAIVGFVLIWLVFTSIHSIAPGQRGVVTAFGRYSRTLGPGVGFTLPVADRAGEEDRRREDPHRRSRLGRAAKT